MSTRRLPYIVATAAVMVLSVVLAAPGLATAPASVHASAASPAAITIGPVPHSGVSPDAGPYTIISPACSVSGGVASITTTGSTFTVDAAFTGAIVDECADSVLNGANYTITPTSGTHFGVQVNTTSGVTVENVAVGGTPTEAVQVINSTDTTVVNALSSTGMDCGVLAQDDFGVNITESRLNDSASAGIEVVDSQSVSVSNSYATGGDYGLQAVYTTGLTITNLTATGNTYGIYLDGSSNAVLSGDNVSAESDYGILEDGSNQVTISDVNASEGDVGIDALSSDGNTILDSNLSSETTFGLFGGVDYGLNVSDSNLSDARDIGALLSYSTSLSFWGDSFNASAVTGLELDNSTHVSVASSWASNDGWNGLRAVETSEMTTWDDTFDNVTNGNGNGTELIDSSDDTLTGDQDSNDARGVIDVGSTHVTVVGVNTSNDFDGLEFARDSQVSVTNSTSFEDQTAVGFSLSTDDAVVNYTADDSTGYAFLVTGSDDISVSNSTSVGSAFGPSITGIDIGDCAQCTLFHDSIANFETGLVVGEATNTTADEVNVTNATVALLVASDSVLTVENGNFSNSLYGLDLQGGGPAWIVGNTVFNDTYDFAFNAIQQLGVHVYWNNFVDGQGWTVDLGGATSSNIVFADGYPGGGNFWSNWTGPDTMSGPQQNLPGSDGIVDVPLQIVGTLEDPYPLTKAVSLADMTAQFLATGLPTGDSWAVTFNGTRQSTASNSLLFSTNAAATGVRLSYAVDPPSGWTATPSAGALVTDGSALVVSVDFTPVTYPVSFTETNLPSGTSWSVTVDGTTISGTSGSLSIPLPNGTYDYTINPVAGYTVSPASGQVTIQSAGSTTAVTYTVVDYTVDFTEHGLPSGSTWSVTFDGVLKSLSSDTISFASANGSYSYAVDNVSGYSTVGGFGTLQVSGPGASVQVAFTANSNSGFGGLLYWGLVAAIAILAVALLAVLLSGRRKPPAPNAWNPPASGGGAAPPPPAAGSPAPPPGATGGGPDWKE
jgi:parallel beta-helix repeat protein